MVAPRTNCFECGEELWSPSEACGLCVMCQRIEREREEQDHDIDTDDMEDEVSP